jgi:phosphatidylglycerol:prolipoprotein diacylglycerol transferase
MFIPGGIFLEDFPISPFGLVVLAAVGIGLGISAWLAARQGRDAGILLDLAVWALAGAIVAGRLFYIWNPPPSVAVFYDRRWFLTHVFDLQVGPLAVWNGGFGRAGLLVGGSVGAALTLRRGDHDLWAWADVLTPGTLVMLAILPWANLVNGQLLGPPTSLPWGVPVPEGVNLTVVQGVVSEGARLHPTPAYASLWAVIVLAVALLIRKRGGWFGPGWQFVVAAGLYLAGLFWLDFLRLDVSRGILGLTGLQLICALGVAACGALVWLRREKANKLN